MLYEGKVAAVVGIHVYFLLVRGRRSCGIVVGTTGSNIRRVCGKSIGWGCGRVVHGSDKGITDGGGRGGCFGTWNSCRSCVGGLGAVVGVAVGTRRSCWKGRSAEGLQLLEKAMSSSLSLSLSVRIWKGLLCRVRRWCTIGYQRIGHGVVMVFDVVATLGGVAIATLKGESVSTLGDVGRGGEKLSWPNIIIESWRIAARYLGLVLTVVGIVCPSFSKRSATMSKVLLCSDATETWQWAGYIHHVSAKQKC
jgi:hypothetical protein